MVIKNAKYLDENFKPKTGDILCEKGVITELDEFQSKFNAIDVEGKLVLPGLIDCHIHGCDGADTENGTVESLQKISKKLASFGVTAFLPTLISSSREKTLTVAKAVADFQKPRGAEVLGLRMEGPFLSAQKPGCHNVELLSDPDIEFVREVHKVCGERLKIVDVAPERKNGLSFIRMAKMSGIATSLGHSNADYETAVSALEAGAVNITHLYNAMSGLNHRSPGLVGATFDSPFNPFGEIICDGVHVHPATVRIAAKMLSRDRLIFISDSMQAAGLSDGMYKFGGMDVVVKNSVARTLDGTIAGSTTNVAKCLKNAVDFGIPFEMAVRAVTINPARLLGMEKEIGSIAVGKRANFTVLDEKLNVALTIVNGKPIV